MAHWGLYSVYPILKYYLKTCFCACTVFDISWSLLVREWGKMWCFLICDHCSIVEFCNVLQTCETWVFNDWVEAMTTCWRRDAFLRLFARGSDEKFNFVCLVFPLCASCTVRAPLTPVADIWKGTCRWQELRRWDMCIRQRRYQCVLCCGRTTRWCLQIRLSSMRATSMSADVWMLSSEIVPCSAMIGI